MQPQVMLVLVFFLLSAVFQSSASLKCNNCLNSVCTTTDCNSGFDRCFSGTATVLGITLSGKGCATKAMCESPEAAGKITCCQGDLCNGAEGVKLSLLIMLVPLLSSILFL